MLQYSHLEEKNITYKEHFCIAIKLSIKSCLASVIFMIHGFFPNIFPKTGSNIIIDIYNEFDNEFDNNKDLEKNI
jgi:hypothetical protein